MGKYKNISVVLGCVLCTIVAQANSPQMSEDKAMQYAQKVILDRLGEKDRELTTSEQKIANEIVKSYLVLQDEYERSLTQPQMIWTSSISATAVVDIANIPSDIIFGNEIHLRVNT